MARDFRLDKIPDDSGKRRLRDQVNKMRAQIAERDALIEQLIEQLVAALGAVDDYYFPRGLSHEESCGTVFEGGDHPCDCGVPETRAALAAAKALGFPKEGT
jgi:hypothetical protein